MGLKGNMLSIPKLKIELGGLFLSGIFITLPVKIFA